MVFSSPNMPTMRWQRWATTHNTAHVPGIFRTYTQQSVENDTVRQIEQRRSNHHRCDWRKFVFTIKAERKHRRTLLLIIDNKNSLRLIFIALMLTLAQFFKIKTYFKFYLLFSPFSPCLNFMCNKIQNTQQCLFLAQQIISCQNKFFLAQRFKLHAQQMKASCKNFTLAFFCKKNDFRYILIDKNPVF